MVLVQLQHFIDAEEGNLEKLQHMYEKWPFFHSLLSNVDMVLSKSNMNIAFQYSKLTESEEVRNVFNIILDEWQLTKMHRQLKNMITCWKKIHHFAQA